MIYISEDFSDTDHEKLCADKLDYFSKGFMGHLFNYESLINGKQKKLLVKRTISADKDNCNEAFIAAKINRLMDDDKIPDMFVKVYLIYHCKNNNFNVYVDKRAANHHNYKSYVFVMERYEQPIWQEIDRKDIKKVKSIVMLMLIAIWFMNHIGDVYHDDIVAGKPDNLVINNVLIEKTSKENMEFSLNSKKKINIKLYGYQPRIIDFGNSCQKDIYNKYEIRTYTDTSINQFYAKNKYFKKLKFKSEIVWIIKCLFTYWKLSNLDKIDKLLFKYYNRMTKYDSLEKFDEDVIYDFNKNFIKIIRMFSSKWPNPPYYV